MELREAVLRRRMARRFVPDAPVAADVVRALVGLALRALHFVIPGRTETTVIGNLILSWGGAWYLLDHMVNPAWLPWAVAAGVLTHIVGDGITTAGVPMPLLWIINRGRVMRDELATVI